MHSRFGVCRFSSSLMGSLAKGILRKVCANSAENSQKFEKYVWLRQERVRKFCGKFAEISQKFVENYLQWPLPERPHKWIADRCNSETRLEDPALRPMKGEGSGQVLGSGCCTFGFRSRAREAACAGGPCSCAHDNDSETGRMPGKTVQP